MAIARTVAAEPQVEITLTMEEAVALYNLFGNTPFWQIDEANLPNLFEVLDPHVEDYRRHYPEGVEVGIREI